MLKHETMARTIAAQCTCLRARKAARSLTNVYDDALKSTGIEMSQLSVLAAIAHFGDSGASVGVLADVLALDRTTLTRNLVPLEKANLLRLARSPTDRRAKIVVLTRAGERAIEEAFPLWQRAQEQVSERIGKTHVDAIVGELDRLASRMKRDEPARAPSHKQRR